jgi:O-antigen/teichoic acid export membrane protein
VVNIRNKAIIAFFWDFFGKVSNQIVGLIISIFLSRLLSPSEFGTIAMVNVFIFVASIFADFGISQAIIQKKEVSVHQLNAAFTLNLVLGIILALLMYFSSPFLANFYNNPKLESIFKVMSIIFILNSFGYIVRAVLRRRLNFSLPVKVNLFSAVLSGSVGITLALLNFGIWSLVTQILIGTLLNNLLLLVFSKSKIRISFAFYHLSNIWKFSLRMFIANFLNTVYSQLDYLIIGKRFPASDLGQYDRARNMQSTVFEYSSRSIVNIFFPIISQYQNDREKVLIVVNKTYSVVSWVTFFLSGLLFSICINLIPALYGEKWILSATFLSIILLGGFSDPLSGVLINILIGLGNSKMYLRMEVIKKILFACSISTVILLPIKTYLYINAITYIIAFMINAFFAAKELNLVNSYFIKMSFPYFITAAIISLLIRFSIKFISVNPWISILYGCIIFSSLYILTSWIVKLDGLKILLVEIKLNIFSKNSSKS